MVGASMSLRSASGRYNGLRRLRAPDDPEVLAAAAELKARQQDRAYVRRLVDSAGPLSPEVKAQLADLLPPVKSTSDSGGGE